MSSRTAKLIFGLITMLSLAALPATAKETTSSDTSRSACCRQDSGEVAQLHKNAEQFYNQFKAQETATELRKVLQIDSHNFEALVKLARAHIDIGDQIPESGANWKERRLKEYGVAEDYARRAVKVDPNSTWGHFYVAASLGNIAMLSPVARQVELAEEIRRSIERSLALDERNGFAYHAYGVWHRKMAEIGRTSRILASVFYGRQLPTGSVERSIDYFKRAISINNNVIITRLELARSYIAAEEWNSARALLKTIPPLPNQFSDDEKHKKLALSLLD